MHLEVNIDLSAHPTHILKFVDGQGGLCEDDCAVEQDRRPLAEQVVGLEEGRSKQAERLDWQGHGAGGQFRAEKEMLMMMMMRMTLAAFMTVTWTPDLRQRER